MTRIHDAPFACWPLIRIVRAAWIQHRDLGPALLLITRRPQRVPKNLPYFGSQNIVTMFLTWESPPLAMTRFGSHEAGDGLREAPVG